jgi:hypothetical protein
MFADMPLDNRTVDLVAALCRMWALAGPVGNVTAKRSDLIFRRDRLFCNIEPKKRQYG